MAKGTIVKLDEVDPKGGYCGTIYELIKPHNSHAERLSCVWAEVPPGARSRPHRHPVGEELYLVVSGTGIIHLGDQTWAISAGCVVHIPPEVPHMIENSSTVPLQLFVVNTPPYEPENVIFEEGES
jgi:mannose-6-phosphate isomerase-like protein (cupin superfamily)